MKEEEVDGYPEPSTQQQVSMLQCYKTFYVRYLHLLKLGRGYDLA